MAETLKCVAGDHLERRKYPGLRKIVDHPVFNLAIIFLIVVSVCLILLDTFAPFSNEIIHEMELANHIILVLFIIELFMRWLVSPSSKYFFHRHWIDILAVIPMLRVFRLGRIFQLIRLVRIFSLGAAFQSRITFFGNIFEGRVLEYGIIFGFLVFVIIFGAVGLSQFEVGPDAPLKTHQDAFWKALFSLLEGQYGDYPHSIGGKIVLALLLLFGMGLFAMLTGTVSAIMIEKLKESAMHKTFDPEDLKGHIVICGYSAKAAILIKEFALDSGFSDCDILVVSENADLNDLKSRGVRTDRVFLLKEDFTRLEALTKAGIIRAKAAIVLSEAGGNRSTMDIDARTILAALTIEKINPKMHTSAELYHEEYADHLKVGGVEDVVIQGEVSGKLLARVAMQQGLLAFFQNLLSRESGNTLDFVEVPKDVIAMDVEKALPSVHAKHSAIIVGVRLKNGKLLVNPKSHILNSDDQLLIIRPMIVES